MRSRYTVFFLVVYVVLLFSLVTSNNSIVVSQSGLDETSRSVPRQSLVEIALEQKGTPYVWGGHSPAGFDSSGIIWYVFHKHGIDIPRVSFEIYEAGEPIEQGDLLPGDLVFFEGYRSGPSHGGIYIGDGEFIHSPSAGKTVSITSLDEPYYRERFYGARRYVEDVRVFINKEKINFTEFPPIHEAGRILVPVRPLAEALGARVDWFPGKGDEDLVRIQTNKKVIDLSPGSPHYIGNGQFKKADTAVKTVRNRTMVPIRLVAEELGAEVKWQASKKRVDIMD